MSIKLRNRKAAESHLGQFVEDLTVPPKLISNILESDVRSQQVSPCGQSLNTPVNVPLFPDGRAWLPVQVSESYLQYLVKLHTKLEFTQHDDRVRRLLLWVCGCAR